MVAIPSKVLASAAGGAADVKGLGETVTKSSFWKELSNVKGSATTALAGGATGMVLNAGYNAATDSNGGYAGAALLGAGGAPLARAAWKSGGQGLFHTAEGKVKQTIATAGGTKAFEPRVHENQHLTTSKNGSFDVQGQKNLVRDIDSKLANMNPGDSNYDNLLKQKEAALNGLDHMNSVIDNRLSQTPSGAQQLATKYDNATKNFEQSPVYQARQRKGELINEQRALNKNIRDAESRIQKAIDTNDIFKKAGGDINSPESIAMRQELFDAHSAKHTAEQSLAKWNSTGGQELTNINNTYTSEQLKAIGNRHKELSNRAAAAKNILNSHTTNSSNKSILNDINLML